MNRSSISLSLVALIWMAGAAHAERRNASYSARQETGRSAAKDFNPFYQRVVRGGETVGKAERERLMKTEVTVGDRLFGLTGNQFEYTSMKLGTGPAELEAWPVRVNGRDIGQAQLVRHDRMGLSFNVGQATVKRVVPGEAVRMTANTSRGFEAGDNSSALIIVTEAGATIEGLSNLELQFSASDGHQQVMFIRPFLPDGATRKDLRTSLVVRSANGKRSTRVEARFPNVDGFHIGEPAEPASVRAANRTARRPARRRPLTRQASKQGRPRAAR